MKLHLSEDSKVDHAAYQAHLESIIADLRNPPKALDAMATAGAVAIALADFEEKSAPVRAAALNMSFQRVDMEHGEFLWLADIYARLAAAVRTLADKVSDSDAVPPAIRVRFWAHALLAGGNECKWRLIAGLRSSPAQIHWHHLQLGRAQADQTADVVISIPIEGSSRETSVEALYMRALLLERLASGNLNAQQIEILDEWLLAWMHSLIVSRKRPEDENALVADLTGSKGFTLALRGDPEGDPRGKVYLPVKPIMRQLDHAIERFHQGLIFPGFGLGMHFRIEEHAGVIDYLSREFALLMARKEFKQPRIAAEGFRDAAVFVGMNDILTRAVQASEASLLRIAAPMVHGGAGKGSFAALDPAMRVLTVSDVSESGFGLIAGADHQDALAVGDIAAVRLTAQSPATICVVTRKVRQPQSRGTLIGLRILTRTARPLSLEHAGNDEKSSGGTKGARPAVSAIFIPGEDTSGRGDSIIVSETVYRGPATFRARLGSDTFCVTLGRIKKQGRGWKMAAFSVTRWDPATHDNDAARAARTSANAPATSHRRS